MYQVMDDGHPRPSLGLCGLIQQLPGPWPQPDVETRVGRFCLFFFHAGEDISDYQGMASD